jgi:hypothetical protein
MADKSVIPGSKAADRVKGAARPQPVTIDHSFVSDPRGGKPLVVGKRGLEVKDNRTKISR